MSLLLTITGLVLTVAFGLLSTDLFKRKKNPGKLILVKQTAIGLFNNLAKNFGEIAILYKGSAINENVIYIKASITNDGDIDIDGTKVEKTISLKLGENLKWIKAIVSKASPELICLPEISGDESELKFDFGLIKKKEFFQFEALIETMSESVATDDVFDRIVASHRIANTEKIEIVDLSLNRRISFWRFEISLLLRAIGFFSVIGIGIPYLLFLFSSPSVIRYLSPSQKICEATAVNDFKIEIRDLDSKKEEVVSLKEFQENYSPLIHDQLFWEHALGRIAILISMFTLVISVHTFMKYLKYRKIKKFNVVLFDSD